MKELRRAILYLVEVATCYEHRPVGAVDPAAERLLSKVLKITAGPLSDRDERAQREGALLLLEHLAEVYRSYNDDESLTQDDVREEVARTIRPSGPSAPWRLPQRPALTPGELGLLAPSREEMRSKGGADEYGKWILGKLVYGVCKETVRNWKRWKKRNPAGVQSTAFGMDAYGAPLVRYIIEAMGPYEVHFAILGPFEAFLRVMLLSLQEAKRCASGGALPRELRVTIPDSTWADFRAEAAKHRAMFAEVQAELQALRAKDRGSGH